MIVSVTKETFPGERRVALIPAMVGQLTKAGLEVAVEAGAGEAAGFLDAEYEAKGARIVTDRGEAFVGDVERSIALFTEFPSLGSPAPSATRRVRLSRFPYSLVYQVADDVIRVIAVEHQNRLPGFWRGRV